jgi:exosortase
MRIPIIITFRACTSVKSIPKLLALLFFAATAIVAASLPLLFRLFSTVSGKSYYSHVPFIFALAAAFAVWQVWKQGTTDTGIELDSDEANNSTVGFSIRAAVLILGSALLTFLVWYFSSAWLALLAALLGIWGAVHLIGGQGMARLLAPALALVIVSTPLPVGLDQTLVVWLQQLATRVASNWLDLIGIFHVITGVAIQTPTQAYLVEDACSGISSLFAGLCVATMYCIWVGHGFARSILTLLFTVGWLLAANAVRVFAIVVASVRFDFDLTTGLAHEALGIVTFGSGILLALSTERLVLYWLPRTVDRASSQRTGFGQRWFGWLDKRRGSFRLSPLNVAVAFSLIFFGSAATGFATSRGRSDAAVAVTAELDSDRFSAVTMPAEIGDWKLINQTVQERAPDDVFGMKSHIWQYRRGDDQMAISIDGPYDDWHDLAVCYTALGWQLENYENLSLGGANDPAYAVDLQLYREPLDRADILFVCFDANDQIVRPLQMRGKVIENFLTRFRKLFTQATSSFTPPVYQIQVNAQFVSVVSDSDRLELEQVLRTAMDVTGVTPK